MKRDFFTRLVWKSILMTDEELANLCITLINQATYMLRRLIDKQQKMFLQHGGVREQMMKARLKWRNESGGWKGRKGGCWTSRTSRTGPTSPTD